MAKGRRGELFLFFVTCLLKFSDQGTILKKSNSNTKAATFEGLIWSEFDRHGYESLPSNVSGVYNKYLNSLDEKESYKAASWINITLISFGKLFSDHIAVIPSQEFLKNNPNHKGLFNVSLTPEKNFARQFLINLTAVHKYKDTSGYDIPPLLIVCLLPSMEPRTVKYLLGNGIDVNAKTRFNGTALMAAAYGGNLAVVKLLIEKGANLDDSFGFPILLKDDLFCLKCYEIFSKKEPPIHWGSTLVFSSLAAAVSQGHTEVVEYLLDRGANPSIGIDYLLSFPPWNSQDLNVWSVLNLLIQYGLDVNATDLMGHTILHKTAVKGDLELSKLLLKHKADVTATDYFGWTPLHFAALYAGNDSKPLINLLLDNGADINAETDGGFTPLNLLEAGRDKSFLNYLKDNSILIFRKINRRIIRRPPSETESQPELLRLFLDRGAKVDHQDHLRGWSTLHWAAAIGDTPAVKLLVEEYRANVTSISKISKLWTPSDTAKHFNMTEVSEYLSRAESIQHVELVRKYQ